MDFFQDILVDTVMDGLHLLPFLFLTYLAMEYMEHWTETRSSAWVERAGRFGPFVGALLGVFPQCGFSAAAANLYAGRVITVGTLLSIFLSTSDEMVPLFISSHVPMETMAHILGMKGAIGMLCGCMLDAALRSLRMLGLQPRWKQHIQELCEDAHCHCEEETDAPWKAACVHTAHIFAFILLVTFALNVLVALFGEDKLSAVLTASPIMGHFLAGIIGLIPNCAASVVITQLYLSGVLTLGTMMSGLLVGAGVGLLVLYRVNLHRRQNIAITLLLYACGVAWGLLVDLLGVTL